MDKIVNECSNDNYELTPVCVRLIWKSRVREGLGYRVQVYVLFRLFKIGLC